MRTVQVVKMANQGGNAWRDLEGLEHMAANEIGEITHGLHRYGLMEQFQRLFVFNAKAASEPCAVGRETIEYFCSEAAQLLAQCRDIRAEVREVRGNRQCALGADEKPCGLAVWLFHPEDLRERDGLVIPGVMKGAQNDGVVVVISQSNGLRVAGRLVALGFVVAEHVGTKRPFLAVRAGGLVVGNAVRRNKKGGDRIDQRRFTGADIASQEGVLAVRIEHPYASVKRPPVVDLQLLKAEARQRVVGHEVEPRQLHV